MERHRPGKKAELKNALVAIGVVIFFAVFLTGRSFGTVDLSLTSRRFTQVSSFRFWVRQSLIVVIPTLLYSSGEVFSRN